MIIQGKVHIFNDNVDTDVIIPARYLNTFDLSELASHCMEDIDPEFSKKVVSGDIIVAGSNFGCGSSREHAPLAIKASGISCVIAKSFARIFYRNAINVGLPIFECDFISHVKEGDEVYVDLSGGKVVNVTTGESLDFMPFPDFIMKIIDAGGEMNYISQNRG